MKLTEQSVNNPTLYEVGHLLPITVIEAKSGWQLVNWQELWQYRDLFWFMIWRDIKTRYSQSVLGIGWAIIQPVFSMIIFTIVFGNLAKINSDGVPYTLFSYTALVPWTYFSSSLTTATGSLIASRSMITKVYFPRLVIPLAPVVGRLLDFVIALIILGSFMVWYRFTPTIWVLTLPLLTLLMVITAAGMGMWLTALAVQYRDVNYAMSFMIQLLMYAAPVVYPANNVPAQYRLIYAFNPMVGVIEGFRSSLLGTNSMPWDYLTIGAVVSSLLLFSGLFYFRQMERSFADIA